MEELEIVQKYESIRRDYDIINIILKSHINETMVMEDDLKLFIDFDAYIGDIIDKAERYDIEQFKRSQGGKRASKNMTKQRRTERARKAAQARWHSI